MSRTTNCAKREGFLEKSCLRLEQYIHICVYVYGCIRRRPINMARKSAEKTSGKSNSECSFSTPPFKALADPTRLRILLMLEGKPRTVGEIVEFFDLSQPTISRHLQTLTAGGLVKRSRKGQRVFYSVNALNISALCVSLADSFPCCCVKVIPIKLGGTTGRPVRPVRPVRPGGDKSTGKHGRKTAQTKSKKKGAGK